MQRHGRGARTVQRALGPQDIVHRLHLGDHDVGQPVARLPHDGGDIVGESRMVHRMDARSHTGTGRGLHGQGRHQTRMLGLEAHRSAVFAIQRDVKDAGAELLRHLGLQLQALAHAHLNATVMVADRQKTGLRLGAQQHVARMQDGPHGWLTAGA